MTMRVSMIRMLAVVIALAAAVCLMTGCGSRVRIGTGGEGGMYHVVGSMLGKTLSDEYGIDARVKVTAGSAANLRLLDQGYVQLALAQSDVADSAYHGEDDFENNGTLSGYSAVAAIYDETVHIVVPASSGINDPGDLAGKTVSIGEDESGAQINAKQILQAYGLSFSMLDVMEMNYRNAAEALKNGKIDGMFCTAGLETEVLAELADDMPVRFLSIDKEHTDYLMKYFGVYQTAEIPAGTYSGQDEPVSTVCVRSLLLASNDLSDDTVGKVTKALFDHKDEWSREITPLNRLDEESAVRAVTIPFHKGAAAYYEKCGINVDCEE